MEQERIFGADGAAETGNERRLGSQAIMNLGTRRRNSPTHRISFSALKRTVPGGPSLDVTV